jgi:hypothetical protein
MKNFGRSMELMESVLYLDSLRSFKGFERFMALNIAVSNAQLRTRPIWMERTLIVRIAVTSNRVHT